MVVLDRPTSTTSAPIPVRPANPRRALRPKDFRPAEFGLLIVTVVAAISIVWIVFEQLTLLSGTFGFIVCCVVTFLCLYWTVNSLVYGRRVAADRFVSALVSIAALCMFIPLGLLIVYLVIKGWGLLSIHLFVSTQKGVPEVCTPGVPCPKPGILHAMVGTAEQIGLAAAMGIPLAILTAVYLSEVGGFGARAVRIVVTAMSGVPAIVAGLFVYTFWVITFKFSGFAGSLALALLLLPTVTRGTEEVLKIVPNDLREASRALAAPEWRTVWSVVLPTARSGLITAVLLGTAVRAGRDGASPRHDRRQQDPQCQPLPWRSVSPFAPGIHTGEVFPAPRHPAWVHSGPGALHGRLLSLRERTVPGQRLAQPEDQKLHEPASGPVVVRQESKRTVNRS